VFIWLALRPALLRVITLYFQLLKREASLAPLLRNRMVSRAENKDAVGWFAVAECFIGGQKKEEV